MLTAILLNAGFAACLAAGDGGLRAEAEQALRRAAKFFVRDVSTEGGYLWRYSEDLSRREGERKASATEVWVQPPGTPAVGMAYLRAYEATGDTFYLDAARRTAMALVRGQLRSGGWSYEIEFEPSRRRRIAYRTEPEARDQRDFSVLDDDTTQSALRLLLRADKALGFRDAVVHEAAEYGLRSLVHAQHPSGAWPQRFSAPADPRRHLPKPASFPADWPREWPGADYRSHATFNDGAMSDVIEVLLEAAKVYDEPRYLAAAERCGEFIITAQMPEPQPAWAQQYDAEMHPAWARKFEPPAVSGGESQRVIETLLLLYRETGKKKYLDPVPRAIEYLRASKLPDGSLPRFLEIRTNRPLYFTREYKLTYDDADLPAHYAFKVSASRLESAAQDYEELRGIDPLRLPLAAADKKRQRQPPRQLEARVRAIVAALDDRGRWLEAGRMRGGDDKPRAEERVISTRKFIANVEAIAEYLECR
jgi:hypothetical protein